MTNDSIDSTWEMTINTFGVSAYRCGMEVLSMLTLGECAYLVLPEEHGILTEIEKLNI